MRYYTKTDEWVLIKEGLAYVGISKHAVSQLGDIVYVELPEVGSSFNKDDIFGAVESVKAAADLFMPIGGRVQSVNEEIINDPELLALDPLTNYLVILEDFNADELKTLTKKDD